VIGRLVGKIVLDAVDSVVLDVSGVGYEITIPLGAMGRAPKSADGSVTLIIHTHVREDDISLYGFANEIDRFAFRTLISVSNVGPRTALAVLGAMTAEELATAISRKDVGKLTSISGIGKKTAERLVLELAGKLPVTAIGPKPDVEVVRPPAGQADVLLGALTKMGYRPSEAERAVSALGDRIDGRPLADSLKEALALLAK
jgi:Holliday junction DNA helicase RuvA